MSTISEAIRATATLSPHACLDAVSYHCVSAFNPLSEPSWAGMFGSALLRDREQSRTFMLLVACALEG